MDIDSSRCGAKARPLNLVRQGIERVPSCVSLHDNAQTGRTSPSNSSFVLGQFNYSRPDLPCVRYPSQAEKSPTLRRAEIDPVVRLPTGPSVARSLDSRFPQWWW